jgi:3-methyladenine DNA glycosylase/8-oxoguanine DNA glycosylase
MKLTSHPPHDFFLNLDVDSYFDLEHDPEAILTDGFIRPIPLADRDVLATIRFNGDVEKPEFDVRFGESLSANEEDTAARVIRRMLGCDLDLRPLYENAADDPVLSPRLNEYYGLKRLSRANFFEESMNRVIESQIQHKPTAKKMVYGVREAYGQRLDGPKGPVAAWPRPVRMISADPVAMKKHGLSERKGEYVVGIAHEIVSGELDLDALDAMSPLEFLERIVKIRGIGPTIAQDLSLYRNRTDAAFPSRIDKGMEMGFRRWIIHSYGGDPHSTSEEEYRQLIRNWTGFEASAIEFLYVDWVIGEKRKRAAKTAQRRS